ncbi:MAG TPA: hypothetical protein VF482_06350, partial [Trebonia sp.]
MTFTPNRKHDGCSPWPRRRYLLVTTSLRGSGGAGSAAVVAAGALLSVTATGAPSALAAVTSAVAKTSADSYRISMISMETRKLKFSGKVAGRVRVTGEFDPARRIGEEISSRGERDLYIDGDVYWTVLPGEKDVQGKPWVMAHSEPIGRPTFS